MTRPDVAGVRAVIEDGFCRLCAGESGVTAAREALDQLFMEPVYCPKCGACGIEDCCSRTRCHEYAALAPGDAVERGCPARHGKPHFCAACQQYVALAARREGKEA